MERFKKICGIFFALFITLFSLDSFAVTCGVNATASGTSCGCTNSDMLLLDNHMDCVPEGLYNSFNNFVNRCTQRTYGDITPRVTAYRSPNGTGTIIGYRVTCENAATNYPSSVNYILSSCQTPGTAGVYNNASPYCAACSSGARFDATYAICRKDCSSIANSTLNQSTNTCECNSGYTMFADTCYPTITLNVNGGTLSSDVKALYYRTTAPVGLYTDPSVTTSKICNATGTTSCVSVPVPTRDSDIFEGWYSGDCQVLGKTGRLSGNSCVSSLNLATITELVAKWTPKYTVTFKSGNTILGTQTFTYGTDQNLKAVASMSNIPVSSTHGWAFVGWATFVNSTNVMHTDGKSVSISANTTLYGVWKRIVTFTYYDGANATSTTTSKLPQYYYTAQSGLVASATNITTFNITGEHTKGWNAQEWAPTKTGAYLNPLAPVVKNVALAIDAPYQYYAVYNRNVSLDYYGNGNTGGSTDDTTTTQSFRAGNTEADTLTMTLADNGFTRTGYSFNKWAAGSPDGIQYDDTPDSYEFPNTTWTSDNTAEMYATWNLVTYNITYDLNGGSNNAFNPSKYTIETETISLRDPARAYSTFDGWYTNASFTGSKVTQIAKGSTGDKTFYAKWRCNSGYYADGDSCKLKGTNTTTVSKSEMTLTYPTTTDTFTASCASGTPTVASSATGVATVSFSNGTATVTWKSEGTANITVTCPDTTTLNSSNKTVAVTTVKGTITATQKLNLSKTYDNEPLTCNGISNVDPSGATVTYAVQSNGTCGTYGSAIPTRTDAGTTTVCYKISMANYDDKTGTFTCTVNKAANPLTVNNDKLTITYPATGTITVSGAQGSLSVESTDENVATVSSNGNTITVTPKKAGTANINISAFGNNNYETGKKTVSLTVKNGTITASVSNKSKTYDGSALTCNGVSNVVPSGATVKYGTTSGTYNLTSAPKITNVADSKTIYYQITATNYTTKTGSFECSITSATMTVSATGNSKTYNGTALTCNGGTWTGVPSGSTTTYRTSSSASYASTVPSRTPAGTTTVQYQVTNPNYTTVTGTYNCSVSKASNPITISPSSLTLTYPNTGKVTVSNAQGTVTATSSDTSVATVSVSGTTVTVISIKPGNTTVTVKAAGGDNYKAKEVTASITVVKGTNPITLSASNGSTKYGADKTVTVSNAQGTVTATSSNTSVATVSVSGTTVTMTPVKPSTTPVTITVNAAGNDYYNDGKKTYSLTVNKADNTMTISASSGSMPYSTTKSLFTVANNKGTVTATSGTTSVATVSVSGKTVNITSGASYGTSTITVFDSGNDYYASGSKTFSLTVNQGTITLNNNGATSAGTTKIYATYNTNVYLTTWGSNAMTASANGITVPTRTGYTFGGYYDSTSYTTKFIEANGKITSDGLMDGKNLQENSTWYAKWAPNKNTITFNINGGTGLITETAQATYDQDMPTISTTKPTKTACKFMGWYDNATYTSGKKYYDAAGKSASKWDKTSDTTLYAGWNCFNVTKPSNVTRTYNGTTTSNGTAQSCASAPTVTGVTGYTVTYNDSESGTFGNIAPTITNAGTKTIYYRVSATDYTYYQGSYTCIMNTKAMEVSASDKTLTYTGYEQSCANVTVSVPSSGATVKYGTASGTYNLTNAPKITNAAEKKTIYYKVTGDNFTTKTGSYTCKMDKASGTTIIKDGNTVVTSGETAYPGTKSLTVTCSGGETQSTPSSSSTSVATVAASGSTLTLTSKATGTATITAKCPETDNYEASSKTYKWTVVDGEIEVTQKLNLSKTYDGEPLTCDGVVVTAPASGATVKYGTTSGTYNLTSAPKITNVKDTKTIYYQVTATNYTTKTGSFECKITKAANPLTVDNDKLTITYPAEGTITVSRAQGSLSVESTNESVATVSSNGNTITVTPKKEGTANINISAFGNDNYNYGQETVSLIVLKGTNTLLFDATSGSMPYSSTKTFTITKNTSGGTLTATSSDETVATATISGTTVTIRSKAKYGQANIVVASAATEKYNSATKGYTITVNQGKITLNDGDADTSGTTTIYQTYNKGVYLNDLRTKTMSEAANPITKPSRLGYVFMGYYSASNGLGKQYINGDGYITSDGLTDGKALKADATWYAFWVHTSYTVTFKSGNKTLGTQSFAYGTAQNLKAVTSMSNIPVSSTHGWDFAGWATSVDNTNATYTDGESVSNLTTEHEGNVTLYGIWKRDVDFKYYISETATSTTTKTRTQHYRNTTEDAAAPTAVLTYALTTQKTYKWAPVGWVLNSTSDTETDSDATTTPKNVTPEIDKAAKYYALYKRTATLAYDGGDGAEGSTASTEKDQYFNAGSDLAVPLSFKVADNGFTRTGYNFARWHSTGTNYHTEGTNFAFSNRTWASSNTITLTAIWNANCNKITLNKNGGTGGPDALYKLTNSTEWFTDSNCSTANKVTELSESELPKKDNADFNGYFE